jgi:hypothetical protein
MREEYDYCEIHSLYYNIECNECRELIVEVLNFYANQLLDYNEVVSHELLADKGQKARDLLALLAEKSKS